MPNFENKSQLEDIGVRNDEIKAELSEMKKEADSAQAEERSLDDSWYSKWDELENEYQSNEKKAEAISRLSRFDNLGTRAKSDMPTPEKRYSGKSNAITRSDINNALRAFIGKGQSHFSERWADAAERCNVNWRGNSLNFRLKSDSELIHERDQSTVVAEGGHGINGAVVDGFEKVLRDYWTWGDLVTVKRKDSGAPTKVLTLNDAANKAGYLEELGTQTNTSMVFAKTDFLPVKVGTAVFPISNEVLQDSSEDLLSIITQEGGQRMADFIASEITNGDGTAGHLTGYTLDSVQGGQTFYVDAFDSSDFNEVYYSLKEHHRNRPNCVWSMSSATMQRLEALEDTTGRPLFGLGLNASPQSFLKGKRIVINDALPATFETGDAVVYFGDFSKIHVVIARDIKFRLSNELYWKDDAVAVQFTMRLDSKLVDPSGGGAACPIKHMTVNTASGAPSIED